MRFVSFMLVKVSVFVGDAQKLFFTLGDPFHYAMASANCSLLSWIRAPKRLMALFTSHPSPIYTQDYL